MSRDNIIGLVLIMAIMIGYGLWTKPSEEELQQRQAQRDSLERLRDDRVDQERQQRAMEEQFEAETLKEDAQMVDDSVYIANLKDRMGLFSTAAMGEQESFVVESDVLKISFNNKGGFIDSVELKEFKTWEKDPLQLLSGENDVFNLQFYSGNRIISTDQLYFSLVLPADQSHLPEHIVVSEDDYFEFALRLYTDMHSEHNPSYLEYVYGIKGNDYMVDFHLNTVGMQQVIAANSTFLNLDWQVDMLRNEKNRSNEQNVTTIFYRHYQDDVENLRETRDATERLTTSVHWMAFKQQFFSTALIAHNNFRGADLETRAYDENYEQLLKRLTASIDIPYNAREDNHFPMNLYMGPNHFNTLNSYDIRLEDQINLGWFIMGYINRFIVIPVFNYLDSFNWGYGLIIFVLTLMLKMVLFPIAYKTYLSSARMRVLKPDIDELGTKYPKKEDAMKKQQAVMALYKKAGVNPMAGCVPMLLQLPILIALFRFFPSSIELRQEAFLWADDLSSYDSILDLPFTIPFYGDHVSLFTLLMAASMVVYTHMNSQMMNTGTQMPGMKTMMYLMPVMMLGFFNSFASGLSYYYFLANVITFAQMYAFRFMIDEDKIRKKIEENKKKPVKKSGWQKRLEDMAKQQQQKQKKGKR